MSNLVLEGFPYNCKVNKLVFIFRSLLKRENIREFWVEDFKDIRGSDLKAAYVRFNDPIETEKACRVLDRFQYTQGQDIFPISAHIERRRERQRRSPPPFQYGRGREQDRYNRYSRDRSRSPLYGQDSSKLDLEIELLKKQRMIIEEERRLLLERKKLELVQEFGPRALQEFELEEAREGRGRYYRSPGRSPPRPRPRRPGPVVERRRDRPSPPRRADTIQHSKKLPSFLWPCKIIIRDMRELIDKSGVNKAEINILIKLIRVTLRKRLAVLCEGKPLMSGPKLAALYRERYPTSADEVLVQKHLKDVRESHFPVVDKKQDGKKETKKDVVKEDKDKKKANGPKEGGTKEGKTVAADGTKAESTVEEASDAGKNTEVDAKEPDTAKTELNETANGNEVTETTTADIEMKDQPEPVAEKQESTESEVVVETQEKKKDSDVKSVTKEATVEAKTATDVDNGEEVCALSLDSNDIVLDENNVDDWITGEDVENWN